MTFSELVKNVNLGDEVFFYYHDDEYWISQNADGYYLTKSYCHTQEFKSSEELFEEGRIDGKSLFELWNDIKQYFK